MDLIHMRKHEAYPSKYLKAVDVTGPTASVVRSVTHEPMQDGKLKPIVFVDGFQKGIVVNVTNADCLYCLAGTDDDADWPGTAIEIFTEMARMPGREPAPSIRFRAQPKQRAAKVKAEVAKELNDEIPF
jgi:hypothetical protein